MQGMYGRSSCGLSDLARGLGTGGMGDSNGASVIVSAEESLFDREPDAIVASTFFLLCCVSLFSFNHLYI
jgi:hypothetical protein